MIVSRVRPDNSGKVFVTIIITLFIVMLSIICCALYYEKEKLGDELVVIKDTFHKEKNSLKEELYKEEKLREKVEQALKYAEEKYQLLNGKFEQLETSYKEQEDLKKFLVSKFADLTQATVAGWDKLSEFSSKFDRQLAGLIKNDKNSSDGDPGIKDALVELPPVIVKQPTKKDILNQEEKNDKKKTTNAVVMSINPQHNFVVINKGLVDGFKVGVKYVIQQKGKKIAVVKISELRDFVSLGIIEELTGGVVIKEGDRLFEI